MPSVQLRWWNLGGGGQTKADAATTLLAGWGGAPVGPGGAAWPAGGAPAAPAAMPTAVAACEVNGNLWVIPNGLNNGTAAATASPAPPSPAGRWVAVKWRTTAANRRAQKGYYGTNPAPMRFDTGASGAWTGAGLLQRRWDNYPNTLGAALAMGAVGPAPVNRPNADHVRNLPTRRELLLFSTGTLIVAWYHAISGGGAATVYDLCEVLDWLTTVARIQAIGGPQRVVLIGDINLRPGVFNNYLGGLFGALGIAYAGAGATGAIAANQYGILHTGTSTQNGGNELDYAIVMNVHAAGVAVPVPAPAPIRAFIQCGILVGGVAPALGAPVPPLAIGGPAPGAGAFASLAFGGHQTDHRPLKFQLDY